MTWDWTQVSRTIGEQSTYKATEPNKVGDCSRGRPEGSLFNSYYIEVSGRVLLFSLDFSTLPLRRTLYCWVLSKEVSSNIFKVFVMTQPGIEPRSPGLLAFTLATRPMKTVNNRYCASFYSADLFTILSKSHADFHLKVLEIIYIFTHKSSLCKQRECLLGLNLITIWFTLSLLKQFEFFPYLTESLP